MYNRHMLSSYFPLPVPDVTRPWGADCSACVGFCGGHYLEPENAWKCVQEKGMGVCQTKPPSVVLQSVFNLSEKKGEDLLKNENALNDIAKEVLLTPNDVKMWIDNREQGKLLQLEQPKKVHINDESLYISIPSP